MEWHCHSIVVFAPLSGYQDSNLGPPAPKAGALTGLRYTPKLLSGAIWGGKPPSCRSWCKDTTFN